jgi:nitrogen fixation protein FixH
MLAVVFVFFGVIIAVNIALAVAATGTFPGLVVENSYVSSQHYDELLARAHEQDKAGWRDELKADGGVLRFSLSRGAAEPLRDLSVIAHVGRPSTTAEDRVLDLAPVGDGSYAAKSALSPGLWEVDLEVGRGADLVFRKTQEIFNKPVEARS